MVFDIGTLIGENFVVNGRARSVHKLDDSIFRDYGVYEVLRLQDGVLYYPAWHAQRMIGSAKIINLKHQNDADDVIDNLEKLLDANDVEDARVRVVLLTADINREASLFAYLTKPFEPAEGMYEDGVNLVNHPPITSGNPNAKIVDLNDSGQSVAEYARSHGAFDVLFYGLGLYPTQGIRTNFFWTDGKTLFTAPRQMVLQGVTRANVMQHATDQGIQVVETNDFPYKDFSDVEGAFVTGTSIGILPVRKIDSISLDIPDNVRDLMKSFQAYNDAYAQQATMRVTP